MIWAQCVGSVKAAVRRMEGRQSGDDSELKDVWEEWKYQLQQEESIFFEHYNADIKLICLTTIEALRPSEQRAMWTQLGTESSEPVDVKELAERLFGRMLEIAINEE